MTNRQFAKRRFKRSFDPRLVWLRQVSMTLRRSSATYRRFQRQGRNV